MQRSWGDHQAGGALLKDDGVGGEAVEEEGDGKETSCQEPQPGGVERKEKGGD